VKIAEIEVKLDQVLSYIYNDAKTGRKGLVQEFDELKTLVHNFLEEQKTKEAVKKAKLAVWGMVGAAFVWLLEKAIEKVTVLLHL
jgi:hypothetical protein